MRNRILYVEDHQDTQDLIRLVLEQHSFEVVCTDTIAGAMNLAMNRDFDLYLFDTRLPDGSGADLCKTLRDLNDQTPIVFLSAAAYEFDRRTALESGAQGYLTKPCANGELCDFIGSVLGSVATAR